MIESQCFKQVAWKWEYGMMKINSFINTIAMRSSNLTSDISHRRPPVTDDHPLFDIRRLSEEYAAGPPASGTDTRYRILFLNNGACKYQLDKKTLSIDPSTIGIIRPNNLFFIGQQDTTTGYVISFTHDFVQLSTGSSVMLQSVFLHPDAVDQVPVPKSELRFLQDLMERLVYEYDNCGGMEEEVVRGLFEVFAVFLSRATAQLDPVSPCKCLRQTKKFFSLLDQHFATLKMPADYAKLMAVTPAYLNNIVKETLGNTTSYFIQQRILAEAKRLISYDEVNMKELAYRLGFFDVSHFSKFFKRISGERFTDYKRTIAA